MDIVALFCRHRGALSAFAHLLALWLRRLCPAWVLDWQLADIVAAVALSSAWHAWV